MDKIELYLSERKEISSSMGFEFHSVVYVDGVDVGTITI